MLYRNIWTRTEKAEEEAELLKYRSDAHHPIMMRVTQMGNEAQTLAERTRRAAEGALCLGDGALSPVSTNPMGHRGVGTARPPPPKAPRAGQQPSVRVELPVKRLPMVWPPAPKVVASSSAAAEMPEASQMRRDSWPPAPPPKRDRQQSPLPTRMTDGGGQSSGH